MPTIFYCACLKTEVAGCGGKSFQSHPYNKDIFRSYPIDFRAPSTLRKTPKQAQEDTSPAKIDVTSKFLVGDMSVVRMIKNTYYN